MNKYFPIGKYSFGMGDRFARQARAQLQTCARAASLGTDIVPVWNKSNREHVTIGSEPAQSRAAADAAVKALHWNKPYFLDADHIRLETVDRFLPHSDFFTIDVADWIAKPAPAEAVRRFLERHGELVGAIAIEGIHHPFQTTRTGVESIVNKYLLAVLEAGKIYRHIAQGKGAGNFVTEVSMDETDAPQTPVELLVILAALSDEGIPLQTIAPKFTGRFNKGVDYAGDVAQFEKEFNEDLAVIAFAVRKYGLPATLKLSVHSGSDKFSIYGAIRRALRRFGAGVHVKTAGTTWLEEVIGLAEGAAAGWRWRRKFTPARWITRMNCARPTRRCWTLIGIGCRRRPQVGRWTSEQFVSALRHDQKTPLTILTCGNCCTLDIKLPRRWERDT